MTRIDPTIARIIIESLLSRQAPPVQLSFRDLPPLIVELLTQLKSITFTNINIRDTCETFFKRQSKRRSYETRQCKSLEDVGKIINELLAPSTMIIDAIHANNNLQQRGSSISQLQTINEELEQHIPELLNGLVVIASEFHAIINSFLLQYDTKTFVWTDMNNEILISKYCKILGLDERVSSLLEALALFLPSPRISLRFNQLNTPNSPTTDLFADLFADLLFDTSLLLIPEPITAKDIRRYTSVDSSTITVIMPNNIGNAEQRKALQMAMFKIAFKNPQNLGIDLEALYGDTNLPEFDIPDIHIVPTAAPASLPRNIAQREVSAARLNFQNASIGETETSSEVYKRALNLAQTNCVKEYVRIRPVNNGDVRATEIQLTQKGIQVQQLYPDAKDIPFFDHSQSLDATTRQFVLQNQVWTKFRTEIETVDNVKGTCLNFTEVFEPAETDPKGQMFQHFIGDKPLDKKYVVNVNGGVINDFDSFVQEGHSVVHTDFLKYGNRLRPKQFYFNDDGKVVMDVESAKANVLNSLKDTLKPTYEDWKKVIAEKNRTSVDTFVSEFVDMMKFSAEIDRKFVNAIWPNVDVYFPTQKVSPKNVILLFYGASGSGKTHSSAAIIDKIFETIRSRGDEQFSLRLCSDYQNNLYDYYGQDASATFSIKFAAMNLENINYQAKEVIELNKLAAEVRAGGTKRSTDYTFFEGLETAAWTGTLSDNSLTSKQIPKDNSEFLDFELEMKKRVAAFRSVTDTGLNPESSRSHLFYIFERSNTQNQDGKYLIVADLAGTEDLNYLMPEAAWDIVKKTPTLNVGANARNEYTCWINGGKTRTRDWSCINDMAFTKKGLTWNENNDGWKTFKEALHEGWKNVKLTTALANELASLQKFPTDQAEYEKLITDLTAKSKRDLASDPRTSAYFINSIFDKKPNFVAKPNFDNPNKELIALQVISMRGESKHINQSLEEIGAMVKYQKEHLNEPFPSPQELVQSKTRGLVPKKYGKWLSALNDSIVKDTGEPLNMIESKKIALNILAPVMQSKISVVLIAALSPRRTNDYDNFITMKKVKSDFKETCVPEKVSC